MVINLGNYKGMIKYRYIVFQLIFLLLGCSANSSKMNQLLQEEKNNNNYSFLLNEYAALAENGYEPAQIRFNELKNYIEKTKREQFLSSLYDRVNQLNGIVEKRPLNNTEKTEIIKISENNEYNSMYGQRVYKNILKKSDVQVRKINEKEQEIKQREIEIHQKEIEVRQKEEEEKKRINFFNKVEDFVLYMSTLPKMKGVVEGTRKEEEYINITNQIIYDVINRSQIIEWKCIVKKIKSESIICTVVRSYNSDLVATQIDLVFRYYNGEKIYTNDIISISGKIEDVMVIDSSVGVVTLLSNGGRFLNLPTLNQIKIHDAKYKIMKKGE